MHALAQYTETAALNLGDRKFTQDIGRTNKINLKKWDSCFETSMHVVALSRRRHCHHQGV